ncbi:MAG: hypothetical protein HQL27_06515, partial [Candidatus Omnitrophica bacterium]|nr:hypothetical protein [Candidatus Omnitrophota bacterium]
EFLNRVDDIIVFKSLSRDNLFEIVKLEVKGVEKRLKEKDISLEIDNSAFELLIDKGFDPVYGARPLKRTIQRLLEDPLAEYIISGQAKAGSKIKVVRSVETLFFE